MRTFFRIIAIYSGEAPKKYRETKEGVELNHLKILKPNTVYSFQSNFEFPNNDFSFIKVDESKDINLYHLNNSNTSININAIVGSNGSGKSTLIELFYWANYNLGCKTKVLKDSNNRVLKPFSFLNFEILYSISKQNYISLKFEKNKIIKQYFSSDKGNLSPKNKGIEIKDLNELSDFFYSIVVNYSHYALNSLEIGDWINPLFHKNDGYQTPIVLNPMRTKGNIDVNKEKRLLKRRLIANLLEDIGDLKEIDSLRNLGNNKIITDFKLSYQPDSKLQQQKPKEIVDALLKALNLHFDIIVPQEDLDSDHFTNVTINYIITKLEKISSIYPPFRKFKKEKSIKYVNAFIKKIKESDSHIIFKVKGSILYLKYYKRYFSKLISLKEISLININTFSDIIKEINALEKDFWVNTFILAPPTYFDVEFISYGNSIFDALSSGEKQRIHSVSSIVYHLINLNSVEKLKEKEADSFVNYEYVNIILDEIELYYHPEWQRRYIADLLDYFSKINSKNIDKIKGINILFLTHSPYILSDIPLSNTLRLVEGDPKSTIKQEKQTFAANIHKLLANDFLMKDEGFMGEWAKRKINEIILFLNYSALKVKLEKSKEEKRSESIISEIDEVINLLVPYLKSNNRGKKNDIISQELELNRLDYFSIIKSIGEPVLKSKLLEMYNDVFNEFSEEELIKEEIKVLSERIGYSVNLIKE